MSTGQSYLGRGIYANTPPLSAQNAAQPPQLASDPPDLVINERIVQVQSRLLDLVDRFVTIGYENGPIQAVGNLLHYWLIIPSTELATGNEGYRIESALLLADLLDELLKANLPQGGEGQAHE